MLLYKAAVTQGSANERAHEVSSRVHPKVFNAKTFRVELPRDPESFGWKLEKSHLS